VRVLSGLTLALALALSGCGSGSGDAIKAAGRWLVALQQRDATAACKLMAPGASELLAHKYVSDKAGRPCPDVVRGYRARLSDKTLKAIVSGGLEAANRRTKDGRLGVFPDAKGHDLDVILMQQYTDGWKVVSTGIQPDNGG
jgi:hypothetical protein